MNKPDLSSKSPEELVALFLDPRDRVFATHEMAARGEMALDAIRGVLDGSTTNPSGAPLRDHWELYRCTLVSARLMGSPALCLEPLLREAVTRLTGVCAAEAVQALVAVGWRDDETLLLLVDALDREADVSAEAAIAILRAGKRTHPAVVERLEASARARMSMDGMAAWIGYVTPG
jgi:hypothetical protein